MKVIQAIKTIEDVESGVVRNLKSNRAVSQFGERKKERNKVAGSEISSRGIYSKIFIICPE